MLTIATEQKNNVVSTALLSKVPYPSPTQRHPDRVETRTTWGHGTVWSLL